MHGHTNKLENKTFYIFPWDILVLLPFFQIFSIRLPLKTNFLQKMLIDGRKKSAPDPDFDPKLSQQKSDRLPGKDCRAPIAMLAGCSKKIDSTSSRKEWKKGRGG